MKQIPAPEIFSQLTQWALRPDAFTDLRNIFGGDSDRYQLLLQSIRSGDFSWVPQVQILPADSLGSADGAYSRETGTIYLSSDCPADLKESVLLEEIGHHIDALFNEQETPGDEGSLFSAAVRGITLSDEEITAILNEDDSALLSLNGHQVAVECAAKPAPPSRAPLKPIVTVSPGTKSGTITGTGTQDSISSAVSYDLSTTSPAAHGLTLTGSGNLTGYGNSQIYNYLDARQNSGNTTLFAGPSNPSAKGPSSSTLWGGAGDNVLVGWTGARAAIPAGTKLPSGFAANTDQFVGGAGSSTIYAGNVASTLIGGQKNNLLIADVLSGANQSLYGGTGPGSSTKNGTTTYYGNTLYGGTGKDTLRSGVGYNTLISGSTTALQSNTLIGGGISNSLVAGIGNDSLIAVSGASTLIGGIGKDTLLSGTGTNSLVSGSAVGLPGNGNLLNATLGTSNTLVAGLGRDTLIGGTKQNLLLVNQANLAAFATDNISLSTLSSASNTLGVNSPTPVTITDALFATMATAKVSNLGTVANLPIQGNGNAAIILGTNAEKVGVRTLVSGTGSDTLSVVGYTATSALLDASKAVNRASLLGGGTGNDTFLGSKGGYDTMIGAAGNDSFVIQSSALAGSSFGLINGNGGTDTLRLGAAVNLVGTNFNGVSNIEILQLGAGNNSVGSLQGSGIQKIIGNSGSDTLSANVYGVVKSVTQANSSTITLTVSPGTSSTMGFAVGQVVTGNGVALGTTITGVSSTAAVGATPGTVTISLSNKTISLISQGGAVTGWITGATLEGGTNTTGTSGGNAKGDYLAGYGINELLKGAVNSGPQLVSNTLVSGAFASNTLVGGSGSNLYLINNLPGASALPTIQNPTSLQSASTIQFTGNGVKFNDAALSSVSARAAQKILTANGNNLIAIGQNAALIGIQTIIGGVGSDTFTAPTDYTPSVYFDASRGSGNQSLASGSGNDSLLAGSGNATLVGGDGDNSLRGGLGNNLILSGIGNSTLDSGYGVSTLQADGGLNRFIVRNRSTRILNPYTLERDSLTGQIAPPNPAPIATTPEVGIVDTYVNFDPIQSTEVNQFAPTLPDGSPSITKSPSFASSDLSSFYNLQFFNLLGEANYGVGNALDNTISAAAANALILGMGGNNTLVSSGAGSSLYGGSNDSYASPDLYAYAPIDTRDQAFMDGVMGVAGNNYLLAGTLDAKGNIVDGKGSAFLDGGTGYDDGLFNGSGSNTLIGTGGNDTVLITHQADFISLTGGRNTAISSVDLYQLPDNVSDFILDVTPQTGNSGQVSLAGQRMTAGYAAVSDAKGGNTVSISTIFGKAPALTLAGANRLQVMYGISDGTVYGSDNVPDANLSLSVGTFVPDPKNPATKQAVTLSWTTPLDPDGKTVGQTMGYTVKYRYTDANGAITPWLTYLQGSSQDLTGTSTNPKLLVDNLPATDAQGNSIDPISFDFQVTAQERVLPAYTDADGNLIGKAVSLIGGQGNDVLYGDLLDNIGNISNTRPVLTNNPNPLDNLAGLIHAPYGSSGYGNAFGNSPDQTFSGLFPTYLNGGLGGDDLLIAAYINDGSGQDFTAYEYINGVPMAVTYSGLNTLEGGFGSDTFVVSNGGTTIDTLNGIVTTGAYDQVIKYGKETSQGQHNLIVSCVQYLSLSDTDISQGKFIDQAWAPYSGQYIGGNRLDNTLQSFAFGDTLLGGGGRDSLYADLGKFISNKVILIGGTAYGFDSVGGALGDYEKGQTSSIYRDTDPVPVGVNGPGAADNSQYWVVNGLYNSNRNSDTLVAANGGAYPNYSAVLDGGAGNDSMVGGAEDDTFYVSSGDNSNYYVTTKAILADVVVGGGGNDTVVFTGSDTFWSGQVGSNSTGLSYTLDKKGDSRGGKSISNLILQAGDPIARNGYGNNTSTGNHRDNIFGITEVGSNLIVGNGYVTGFSGSGDNSLDGGGVTGVGVDTLIGNGGNDTFQVGDYYTVSSVDTLAGGIVSSVAIAGATETDTLSNYNPSTGQTSYATDGDWVRIDVSVNALNGDDYKINLGGGTFLIGAAPSSFGTGNLKGGAWNPNDFGIYSYTAGGFKAPNLVAEVVGANLAKPLTAYKVTVSGAGTLIVDGGAGVNHLGGNTETIQHSYSKSQGLGNSDWYKPTTGAQTDVVIDPVTTKPIPGSDYIKTAAIYGGDISASALVPQANTDVHNFLGMGAMYDITQTTFDSSHIIHPV